MTRKTTAASRRSFLTSSARALTAACGGVFLSGRRETASASPLNEIRIGVVGCGGRGRGLATNALRTSQLVRLVAIGDIFRERTDYAAQVLKVDQRVRGRVDLPTSRQFVGFDAYQKVIGAGVDLVFFATPPAFRATHFVAAVQSGKHVYIEKPLGVDSPSVREILAANETAKKNQLSVCTGLTHRYSESYRQLISRLQNGNPGRPEQLEVSLIGGPWEGLARQPTTSELEYQIKNWRRFVWLSGGHMVDGQIHALDNCNWLMNSHPLRATSQGGVDAQVGPERGDIFDYFSTQFHYDDGTVLDAQCSFVGGKTARTEIARGAGWHADLKAGTIYQRGGKVDWRYNKKNDNFHQTQMVHLLDQLQRGQTVNEADHACDATWTALMGRMAAHLGREVTWQETVESTAAYVPPELTSMDATAPTLPDKFGDYLIPAQSFVA